MDLDRDDSNSKFSVVSMASTEEMDLSSPKAFGTGQDADMTEVHLFTQDPMDLKDEEIEETVSVCMSETSEHTRTSNNSSTLRELKEAAKYICFLADKLEIKDDTEDENVAKPTDKGSVRPSLPGDDLPDYDDTTETITSETEAKERYKRNYKRFLEDFASREILLRETAGLPERRIKSSGEIARIVDYCGDNMRISSAISKSSVGGSSAPSTFSDETESTQSSQFNEIVRKICESKREISRGMPESDRTSPISESEASFAIKIDKSVQGRIPDTVFKVPPSPLKKLRKTKDDSVIPVHNRPTDLNLKKRETFYTFCPDKGVLRQCKSWPEKIGRAERKERRQRWGSGGLKSSGVARSLFFTESTPSTKVSSSTECYSVGGTKAAPSLEASGSCEKEKSSEAKETSGGTESVPWNPTSKIRRKLKFGLHAHEETEEITPAEETETPVKLSPSKRKGISSMVFEEHSSTSVKKVRTDSYPSDSENSGDSSEDERVEDFHQKRIQKIMKSN